MKTAVKNFLKEHALRSTHCRSEILRVFLKRNEALSHADLEKEIDEDIDRVTIYRTLNTFLDKGIIHRVLDYSGSTRYALCNDCSLRDHNHEHVHFKCRICGHTSCLDPVKVPQLELPKGYVIGEVNVLIEGRCNKCNNVN